MNKTTSARNSSITQCTGIKIKFPTFQWGFSIGWSLIMDPYLLNHLNPVPKQKIKGTPLKKSHDSAQDMVIS